MAVYTDVSDDDLEQLLSRYDLGTLLSCKGIAEGVENSNFMLVTDRGPFILTLYEKRVDPQDLPFFLGLMEHLFGQGILCPQPVHARDGLLLQEVAGRPAALVTFLNGTWPRKPLVKHCAELGKALAQFHLAVGTFGLSRPNNLSLAGWEKLIQDTADRADEVQVGLAHELQVEIDFLRQNWPENLPAGVIHADLFPDNVFFIQDRLSGLIDFYFACHDFFAYDLAICLNAWCFEDKERQFNATKARALLQEYNRVRPLTTKELQVLPILARGSALRFLLTRLYDWLNQVAGAMVKPKDPLDYWFRLNFHRGVKGPGDYGLD